MAVITHVLLRGVSKEEYDAVREAVGWLEDPPTGGLAHMTFWDGEDCHNWDCWESEDAFAAFGETRLGPGMAKVGVEREPEVAFYPAHEVFLPKAVTLTS